MDRRVAREVIDDRGRECHAVRQSGRQRCGDVDVQVGASAIATLGHVVGVERSPMHLAERVEPGDVAAAIVDEQLSRVAQRVVDELAVVAAHRRREVVPTMVVPAPLGAGHIRLVGEGAGELLGLDRGRRWRDREVVAQRPAELVYGRAEGELARFALVVRRSLASHHGGLVDRHLPRRQRTDRSRDLRRPPGEIAHLARPVGGHAGVPREPVLDRVQPRSGPRVERQHLLDERDQAAVLGVQDAAHLGHLGLERGLPGAPLTVIEWPIERAVEHGWLHAPTMPEGCYAVAVVGDAPDANDESRSP
jgi:hypothetical protein